MLENNQIVRETLNSMEERLTDCAAHHGDLGTAWRVEEGHEH
jgi:hypothetical protein